MMGVTWAKLLVIWGLGLLTIFLPIEVYASRRMGFIRRLIVSLCLFSLYVHLFFGLSVVPVIMLAPPTIGVLAYELLRKCGR